MKILVIDDEPYRAQPFIAAGYDVKIAHGFSQIDFWLTNSHWTPDVICLDHDMPMLNGTQVVSAFWEPLLAFPIWIWSWNQSAAEMMQQFLQQRASENDLHSQAFVKMWETSEILLTLHMLHALNVVHAKNG